MRNILCISLFLLIAISSKKLVAQNKVTIKDWETFTFSSKYGNPITFQWKLERSEKPLSYMKNQYEFWFKFRSKTMFYGKIQPVYVSIDIPIQDRKYNVNSGIRIYPDKDSSHNFWSLLANPKIEFGVKRGWIGTYNNEVEKNCADVLKELGMYTNSELLQDAADAGKEITDFFDDDIGDFASKFGIATGKLFKIALKSFGVFYEVLDTDKMDTPLDAYESAHNKAKDHMLELEKQFTALGKLNYNGGNEKTSGLMKSNLPSTSTGNDINETPQQILKRINQHQKGLKESVEAMDGLIGDMKTEISIGGCQQNALNEYHASFKYNAEMLLSLKSK